MIPPRKIAPRRALPENFGAAGEGKGEMAVRTLWARIKRAFAPAEGELPVVMISAKGKANPTADEIATEYRNDYNDGGRMLGASRGELRLLFPA